MSADGIAIEITAEGDAGYTAVVQESVRRDVDESHVRDVFVVRVRDWFGPRWYGFSHTLLQELASARCSAAEP